MNPNDGWYVARNSMSSANAKFGPDPLLKEGHLLGERRGTRVVTEVTIMD